MSDEDLDPVYATLHFYFDDPESMERFKACNESLNVLDAVREFEIWLRYTGDTHGSYPVEHMRDKLFECFAGNDVKVPGWD